jgi:RNA polymerase sporulation-specific sigma factor
MALALSHADRHIRNMDLILSAKSGDLTAMDTLLKENTRMIWRVVRRFKPSVTFDLDDLFQIGTVGFIKAVHKFNLDSGWRFSTYAVPTIFGEIARNNRDIGGTIRISRKSQSALYNFHKVSGKMEQKFQRSMSIYEIADELGIETQELGKAFQVSAMASFDATIEQNDGMGDSLLELVPDPNAKEFDVAGVELQEAVASLPKNIRQVIISRYFEDKTQSQIGQMLGLSQVQISRLEKQGLISLKKYLDNIKELELNPIVEVIIVEEVKQSEKTQNKRKKSDRIFELYDEGKTIADVIELIGMKETTAVHYHYSWKRARGITSTRRKVRKDKVAKSPKGRKTKGNIVINHVLVDITVSCGSVLRNCAIFLNESGLHPITDVKVINEVFTSRPYAHFINYRGQILGGRLNQRDIRKFTVTHIPATV